MMRVKHLVVFCVVATPLLALAAAFVSAGWWFAIGYWVGSSAMWVANYLYPEAAL